MRQVIEDLLFIVGRIQRKGSAFFIFNAECGLDELHMSSRKYCRPFQNICGHVVCLLVQRLKSVAGIVTAVTNQGQSL